MRHLSFHDAQARNVRNTGLLIACFVLFCVALGFIFGYALGGHPEAGFVGILVGCGIACFMALIAIFAGPATVMLTAGAHEIKAPRNFQEQQLFNVVEEMAIAAGLPMPRVFIIDDPSPNAFAAGRNPQTACVAATRGLLDRLNREELQAVMAHEMGHVRNYDTLYIVVVAVMVGVVLIISDLFLRSLWFGGGRGGGGSNSGGGSDNAQAQVVFLLLGIALAIFAPLIAQILQFAVSRQREYLADATAVDLTRNPQGLINALEKIAGDKHRLINANRGTAALYIINPLHRLSSDGADLFSTHPPLKARIERLRQMAYEIGHPKNS